MHRLLHLCFFLFCIVALVACEEKGHQAPQYSLYVMDTSGQQYIAQSDELEKGELVPEKDGALVNRKEFERNLIAKDGHYYFMGKKTFGKYDIHEGHLRLLASCELKDFFVTNYTWLGSDSLLLLGTSSDYKSAKYAKVNILNMTCSGAQLSLPTPHSIFNAISTGFCHVRDNRLFVGYTYHGISSRHYTTSDTSYLAVYQYPQVQLVHIEKDTRSTYPGVENTVEQGTFEDEEGDFYALACPGIALGNNPNKPTGIYRIKKGQEIFDSSYFFNISASPIQNHAYSLYYVGAGKAIVRSERRDLYKSWDEHWKVPHYEFYLLDLALQTTKKIPLPLDKGTRRQCVIVEGKTVYISLNSDTEGNYVWIYHPESDEVQKGLQLVGASDFILRMDKIQ